MKHSLIHKFEQAGQGQVFQFWDQLDIAQQEKLLSEASEIDLSEIDRLVDSLVHGSDNDHADFSDLQPAPYVAHPADGGDAETWAKARTDGEEALRAGRVAAFVVAGGQGTRLGYNGPKGTFPVSPIKQKTLFQIFAEKILAANQAYDTNIPWFIMTSHANHEATEKFFQNNDYFGLAAADVYLFRQGRMPAVDKDGKILLADTGSIAMSPDGHGGSLRALVRSGATATMEERGIDIISYFQVDNPLIKVIDPTFIGFHIQAEAAMSSKMLPKAYPEEKVGVFCTQRGKNLVIEYSDMPEELMHAKDENGQLQFIAGSIAIHILSRAFVEQMGGSDASLSLPFHRADKKIPTVDESGNPVKPEQPNGVKFEMFVFDALPYANKIITIETRRNDDFSPVKNAEGLDSPETCRNDQQKEFVRWFAAAGVEVPVDEQGLPLQALEVSPLFAYDEPGFVAHWNSLDDKPGFDAPLYLE